MLNKIKNYLNDKYFATVECAHCKKQGRAASFAKSSDGVYYCKDCIEILRYNDQLDLKTADSDLLEKYLNYYDYSQKELAPKFHSDFDYASCHVDLTNRLVKFNGWIFEMENLDSFCILFRPSEDELNTVDGIMRTTIHGNVIVVACAKSPWVPFECCIDAYVRGKVKQKILSGEMVYSAPTKLLKFKQRIYEAMGKTVENDDSEDM